MQKEPRVSDWPEDLDAQFPLILKIRHKLSESHDAINTLRNIRQQVEDWERRTREREAHETVSKAARSLKEKLVPIQKELIKPKAKTLQFPMNVPCKLNCMLA